MVDLLKEILGVYTPLAGEGLASLNIEWIFNALLFFLFVWFILRLILNLSHRGGGRRG